MADNLPFDAEGAFEEWVRLRPRSLRTLQRLLEHRHKIEIPLNTLTRMCLEHRWVERAYNIDLITEADLNAAAFESVAGRMVRLRGETMEGLARSFNKLVKLQASMVETQAFELHYSKGATPDVLLKTLSSMEKIAKLHQMMMPLSSPVRPEEAVGEAVEDEVVGALDPLKVAEQLIALARNKQRPLLELKASVVKSGSAAT